MQREDGEDVDAQALSLSHPSTHFDCCLQKECVAYVVLRRPCSVPATLVVSFVSRRRQPDRGDWPGR